MGGGGEGLPLPVDPYATLRSSLTNMPVSFFGGLRFGYITMRLVQYSTLRVTWQVTDMNNTCNGTL